MPYICFYCKYIGHILKNCSVAPNILNEKEKDNLEYGEWMGLASESSIMNFTCTMKVSMECEGVAEEGGSKRGKFRVEGTEKAVIMRKEKVVEDAGAELVMGCEGEEVTWALVPLHMDVEPCIQECSYAVGGKR